MIKTLLLVLAIAFVSAQDCACVAEEENFSIDCSQDLLTPLEFLEENCQSSCSSSSCQRNFYIIQTHHDYCNPDDVSGLLLVITNSNFFQIPDAVGRDIHDFEGLCNSCDINRQVNPNFPTCGSVDCDDDQDAIDAYNLLQSSCETSCSSTECTNAFQIIRAYHDGCDEDSIDTDIEEALHDFEDVCEDAECNVASSDSPLTCESDDDDDDNNDDDDDNNDDDDILNLDDDSSSGASSVTATLALIATFVFALQMLIQ